MGLLVFAKTVTFFAMSSSFIRLGLVVSMLLLPYRLFAQSLPQTRPVEGLRDQSPQVHALVGGRVVMRPGEVLNRGTVIVREGIVTAVGESVAVPADARVWNLEGQTIYAGFVDGATSVFDDGSSFDASHWNGKVRPERKVADALKAEPALREKWRELGFTTAGVVPASGIFRGSGSAIQLGDGPLRSILLKEETGQYVAFETGGGGYPSSLMGCIALMRQTLSDAKWDADYRRVFDGNPFGLSRPEDNAALQALAGVTRSETRLIIEAGNELDFDRALRIGEEAGLNILLFGNGYEYRQLESLTRARTQLFLPIAFPGKPPVDDPDAALGVSLEQLQHWEFAPGNPAALEAAGVAFAFSTMGHNDGNGFWNHVREAVKRGLDPTAALAALTTRPAAMLGIDRVVGEIGTGRIANFSIYGGDPFRSESADLYQVWIDGKCYPMPASLRFDPVGSWSFRWGKLKGPEQGKLTGKWPDFALEFDAPAADEKADDKEDKDDEPKPLKLKAKATGNRLVVSIDDKAKGAFAGFDESVAVQLAAHYDDGRLSGIAQMPDGSTVSWFGTRKAESTEDAKTEVKEEPATDDDDDAPARFAQYPAGAFGVNVKSLAAPESILIKGATVWPCDGSKPVERADVLMRDGKIVKIGHDLAEDASLVIDGEGKHVTPGLLDAHSHIAISRGVNEGTHAVTVEVRIGDVIDPTDIGIYRQLAGGLTTSNVLHGSANPMGGQNQVIKLRWGKGAEGLKFAGAKPGVKFALGENVKQSNWGANSTTRYPQTRMGVEQIMKDTFLAARNYEQERASGSRAPFRRDLGLDSALEILHGERIVHIHSYRQDEILMFVRLAEQFKFTVGTFQHVLEGYKVADAIAGINAGGSSFSDWWAYKFEVYDAIPFNGAIMHNAGVVTSFNSDDAELGRRMNTEAAKAVKYGGVPEEIALQFVTLNPAKQLRIDDRVGSIEAGKDADFVIWSGHPLSTYSRAEQTWIDGVRYFSLEDDAALRKANADERQRLIAKALAVPDKKKGDEAEPDKDKAKEEGEGEGEEPPTTLAERWRRMTGATLAGYQESLEYRAIYHNGESLHTCSGDSCSACRQ